MSKKTRELLDLAPASSPELQEYVKDTPTSVLYWRSAYDRGAITEEGVPTSSGVNDLMNRDEQDLVKEGLRPDDDNMFKAFADGATRQGIDIAAGFANSFGAYGQADALRTRIDMNAELAPAKWSESFFNRFMDTIGSVGTEMIGAVGATAATGSVAGGAAYTYTRLFGDNVRHVQDIAPDLSVGEALASSIAVTGIQTALEFSGGLESRAAKAINSTVRPLRGLSVASRMQQKMWKRVGSEFLSVSGQALADGVQETFEESAQNLTSMVNDMIISDYKPTGEEIANKLIIEPLTALPAGMFFGAVTAARLNAKQNNHMKPPTDQEMQAVYTKEDGTLDEEALNKESESFNALRNNISQVRGVHNADAVTDVIRGMAWGATRAARASGNVNAMPVDFVQDFQTAFVSDNLPQDMVNVLHSVINDQQMDAWEQNKKVMDIIGSSLGETSAVYSMLNNMNQEVEASFLDGLSEQLEPELKKHAATFINKKAEKAYSSRLQPLVDTLVASGGENVSTALSDGEMVSFSVDHIEQMALPADVYERLTIYPQSIQVGKGKNKQTVRVSARGGQVVLQAEEMAKAVDVEAEEAAVQVETEARVAEGGIEETTGGDVRLAKARRRFYDTASKYTTVDEEMAAYTARVGTKIGEASKTYTIPEFSTLRADAELMASIEETVSGLPENVRNEYIKWNQENKGTVIRPVPNMLEPLGEEMATTQEVLEQQAWERPVGYFEQARQAREKAEAERVATEAAEEQIGRIERKEEASEAVENQEAIAERIGKSDKKSSQLEHDIKFRRNNKELLDEIHAAIEANDVKRVKSAMNKFDKRANKRIKELKKIGAKRGPLGSFVVTDGDVAQMADVQAEQGIPMNPEASSLYNMEPNRLDGLYLSEINTAIFFKNANEATVLHEYSHHLRSLLPDDVQTGLLAELGSDRERDGNYWGVHAEERFADAILTYVRDGKLVSNNEQVAKGITHAAGIIKNMLSLKGQALNETTKQKLDELFADVDATDIHAIEAEAAVADMEAEPPTSEQTLDTVISSALADMEPNTEGWQPSVGSLFGLVGRDQGLKGDDAKAFIKEAAGRMFDWFSDSSSINDLSQNELNQVYKEVYELNRPSREKGVNESVDTLVAFLDTQKDRDQQRRIKYSTRAKEGANHVLNNWRRLIDLHDAKMTTPQWMCTVLDDYAHDGPWRRTIGDPLTKLQNDSAKVVRELGEERHRQSQAAGIDVNQVGRQRVNLGGYKYTAAQAVLLDLANRDINGEASNAKKALMTSNKISEQEFADATAYVNANKDVQALSEYISKAYDSLFDKLAPVYNQVTGKKLGRVPNYFAMQRRDGLYSVDDSVMNLLGVVGAQQNANASRGMSMVKKRNAELGGEIDISDPLAVMNRYTQVAANYIAKAQKVKELSEVLNDPKISEGLDKTYGTENGSNLLEITRDLVTREMLPNARQVAMQKGDRAIAAARTSFTLSQLAGRLMTVLAQPVSKFPAYSLLKGGLLPSTIAQDAANTARLFGVMNMNASVNTRRGISGEYKEKGYVHWLEGSRLVHTNADGSIGGLWAEHANHILESHGNPVTGDIVNHGFTGALGVEVKGVTVGDAAMAGITAADMLTVGSVWLTTFDRVYANETKKGAGHDKAEQKAAEEANAIIAKTQPPRTQFERPQAVTGSEAHKLLFPFSSQVMQNWMLWLNGIWRPGVQAIKSKDYNAFFKGKTEYETGIGTRIAVGMILPAMFMGMRARRRLPTEEELMKDLLFYPIAQIPAVGGTIEFMFKNEADYAQIEQAHTRMLNNSIRSIHAIYQRATGETDEFSWDDTKAIQDAMSMALTFPTAWVRMAEETIKTGFDPDAEFDSDYVLRALSAKQKPLPEED